jgi:hypothetical protein
MQKQFETHKTNAKYDTLEKAMSEAFDTFEQSIDKNFLADQGKKHRCHGLMLDHLEEAFLYALKAMTARTDVKN